MAKETILVVEDDADIVELLQYTLEREGYPVLVAKDGERGLAEARRRKPGLVLLDLMLPGMDGLEICRALKADPTTRAIPVVMLTAKGEESDRTVLRRGAPQPDARTRIEFGDVVLDRERHEVSLGGEVVEFTRSEFRLLWTLARHPGRVYTRDELVERLTDGETVILERNIDVHVSAIRKKLGPDRDVIGTVRGVGYKCLD
jgi:DNA-binding response OmpR family regulator